MTDAQSAHRALRELATRAGILDEYVDQTGNETRATSDDTRRALLAAMGIDASTTEAAEAALHALQHDDQSELIAPVVVAQAADPTAQALVVRAPMRATRGQWRLDVELEDGTHRVSEGRLGSDDPLVRDLPLGYHTIRLSLSSGGSEWNAEQSRIVVPSHCRTPTDVLGDENAFGLIANLYTIRSAANWGVGDLGDLATLATWGGSVGADFVGVNPLHALLNRGDDVSPYSPVSRLFRNPIYIDVARVPELRDASIVRERLTSPELAAELDALRESASVRYEQVMAVKGIALDALHRGAEHGAEYDAFVAAHDPALTLFATWMTLAERHGSDWRRWPAELRDTNSAAVQRFASEHAARVEFHRWLQFETDRQLAVASRDARAAGMRIGLYQDLAIGSSPAGADAWAFPELFAHGASVGAPPDPYAMQGQNWGFPPIDPHALRRTRYRYFIDLLRAGFRHAGALRIDHVLGFFRLFWIPEGKSGADGAYVRYPSNDLFGILALESLRHDALVVGEDLGTVPAEVPPALEKWGVLSSKVMFFERERNGAFKPRTSYPPLALATADTHDMAPIAGFWSERDVDLRLSVGLIDEEKVGAEREQRSADREALLEHLARETVLPRGEPHSPAELRGAIHAFLCRTPSRLVGLSLDDLAGESEPVNVPGVGPDKFKSWTRRMKEPLEVIVASEEARAALRCDGRRGVRT